MGGILAKKTGVNTLNNSINLANGARIAVAGGFVLTVGEYDVGISGGNPYNRKAHQDAADNAAKGSCERQVAANRTYEFADGRMIYVALLERLDDKTGGA